MRREKLSNSIILLTFLKQTKMVKESFLQSFTNIGLSNYKLRFMKKSLLGTSLLHVSNDGFQNGILVIIFTMDQAGAELCQAQG